MELNVRQKKFLEVGQEALDFLITDYNFKKRRQRINSICNNDFLEILYYKWNGQFISLSLDSARYELELVFGIKSYISNKSREVRIGDYLKLYEPEVNHTFGWANSDLNELEKEIRYISELFRRYGQKFFNKDKKLWSDIKKVRGY